VNPPLRLRPGELVGYPFEAWGLSGPDLLGMDVGVLEALGVWPLGHQELLLEAVEQLRLASTSLRTLTERLQELAQGIQSLVQGGLSAGDAPQPPSLTLLARVIDLVGAAKELFSWLNRYLFSTLNDFSASRDIVLLCAQLAELLQAVSAQGHGDGLGAHRGHLPEHRGLQPPGAAGPQGCAAECGAVAAPRAAEQPPAVPWHPSAAPRPVAEPPSIPWHTTALPSPWSTPRIPDTPTPPSDLVGSPQALLSARW
uniref:CRIC domain-containing protein n=1 Tax=Malurus cyaneus samueli TaxID=2593467 RepID=A0A8C5UG73_9PASS